MTRRPAGGGEFSYDMCRNAVEIAAEREQDLVVVIISDFDPKGLDMPKSVARKIEVEAALAEPPIGAHVHHAAVTKEQAIEHALPTSPAKTPAGIDEGSAAAKGYEAHKDLFATYAGQEPAEVNAFEARAPEAYYEAIEECVAPYYDERLFLRLHEARREARDELADRLASSLAENDVEGIHETLAEAIEEYRDRVDDVAPDGFEKQLAAYREAALQAEDDLELDEKRKALVRALRADIEAPMKEIAEEYDTPIAMATGRDDGVLDTERALLEQVTAYKEFDVRYSPENGE